MGLDPAVAVEKGSLMIPPEDEAAMAAGGWRSVGSTETVNAGRDDGNSGSVSGLGVGKGTGYDIVDAMKKVRRTTRPARWEHGSIFIFEMCVMFSCNVAVITAPFFQHDTFLDTEPF
jgi:hypothetical protein